METMAIRAAGRVRIPGEGRCAVDAFRVTVFSVTGGACLDHPGLITFPRRYLVNVLMAVLTLNVINEMGACRIFRRFLLMASIAAHHLGFLCFLVSAEVSNIPVATV